MLTQEHLKRLLSYNAETGLFTWISAPARGRSYAGQVAGTAHPCGYWLIGISGKRYLAHRLAWLFMTGGMPADQIDHKDGDRNNNRFANLRAATNSQNGVNSRASGQIGIRGVYVHKPSGRYRVQLGKDGKKKHVGYYDTLDEAKLAATSAAQALHGEYAHVR